jgi:Uma2 family endonuclease
MLTGISWETYVRLNDEAPSCVRLTYDNGNLEITPRHQANESKNRLIESLFSNLAVGMDIDFQNAGSTTHWNEASGTGFEPDTCFYVTNLDYPFDGGPIILPRDPPPDLVIEVDISRSSLNKMAAYAAVGCREGWRHHAGRLTIFSLAGKQSRQVEESSILPGVRADDLNLLLAEAGKMMPKRWVPFVIDWTRTRHQS